MDRSRPHWSYSAISQYQRCPLQYFFQRVIGIPSRSIGSGAALGSAVHAGLAEYHRRLKENESVDADAILNFFKKSWEEKSKQETIVFRDGESKSASLEQGRHLLELYLQEPPPEHIIAIEHRFTVPLVNSRGEYLETPLVAVTDLITQADTELAVIEFKTSGRAYSESEVQSSLQPTCYVHAVRQKLGQDPNVEYAVLIKTKTPKLQRLKTSRYSGDCGRLGDLVQTIQRAVELGIFYPVESPMNCAACSYRGECRDWGHVQNRTLMEESTPQSQEVATCSPN